VGSATLLVMDPIVGGDQRADLVSVYRSCVSDVYGYLAYRLAGRRQEAEDLTQEVFMAYVHSIGQGKVIDDPRAWLITVARNKLVDHLRRATRPSPTLHAVADDTMAVVDGGVDVARLLDLLPPRQRAAVILRYVDDLPVDDVARVMGLGRRAAESLLARARRTLTEELS
jgi:RNA polymerase sigma-70 factor, ECF subfamily